MAIEFNSPDFWIKLFKFIDKCNCSYNENLRLELLSYININYYNELTKEKQQEILKENIILTKEDNYRCGHLDEIYKKLEKTKQYDSLFDTEMYKFTPSKNSNIVLMLDKNNQSNLDNNNCIKCCNELSHRRNAAIAPNEMEKFDEIPEIIKSIMKEVNEDPEAAINQSNQHHKENDNLNSAILNAEFQSNECLNIFSMPKDFQTIPLNSPLRCNRNKSNAFLNIKLLKNIYYLIAKKFNNSDDNSSIDMIINYYMRNNVLRHVCFARVYDFLYFTNGDLRLLFHYNNNGFNINHDVYKDCIIYLEKFNSRFDQWIFLLNIDPYNTVIPFQMIWILIAFELGDPDYIIQLPPNIKITTDFQNKCLIMAAVNVAIKKFNSVLTPKTNIRCTFKLKRSILYFLLHIIFYLNRHSYMDY